MALFGNGPILHDGMVIFAVRNNAQGGPRKRQERLPTNIFIRRFMQHVLPSGSKRIRHYGILANCPKKARAGLIKKFRLFTWCWVGARANPAFCRVRRPIHPKPPVEQTRQIEPFAVLLPIVLRSLDICRRNFPSAVIQSPVCRRLPTVQPNPVYLVRLLCGSL
jgi:hypothetical protein